MAGAVCIIWRRHRRSGAAARVGPTRPPSPDSRSPMHSTTRDASWRSPRWSTATAVPPPVVSTSTTWRRGSQRVAAGRLEGDPQGTQDQSGLDDGVAGAPEATEQFAADGRVERRGPRRRRAARTRGRAASGRAAASAMSASSPSWRATVSDPSGRKPTAGEWAASCSHSTRARTARSSSGPAARPLTQTRPKLRTEARRGPASASRWTTCQPRRQASRACMVPRTPATDDDHPVRVHAGIVARESAPGARSGCGCRGDRCAGASGRSPGGSGSGGRRRRAARVG